MNEDEDLRIDSNKLTLRKTRTIVEIYGKCNVMISKPKNYSKASKFKG